MICRFIGVKNVPLIQVQHWLGHSTMLTTANMYAHLDTSLVDECEEDIKNFKKKVKSRKMEILHIFLDLIVADG